MVTTVTASNNQSSTCVSTRTISGTMNITLQQQSDGTVTGSLTTTGTQTETAATASPLCTGNLGTVPFNWAGQVTVTAGNLFFNGQTVSGPAGVGNGIVTNTLSFSGALNAGVVSGTVSYSETSQGFNNGDGGPGGVITGSGSTTFRVTLR
jgi:hypothetical protein